jgi:hypothetical protein
VLQQKRREYLQYADAVLKMLHLQGVNLVELEHGDIVYRIVRDEWDLCQKTIHRRIVEFRNTIGNS